MSASLRHDAFAPSLDASDTTPMKTILLIAALLLTSLADARLARSYSAKAAFARLQACPSTGSHKLPCPGYVIDHVKALDCGGADAPSNMAWQTIAEGKAKDRIERIGCGAKRSQQKSP